MSKPRGRSIRYLPWAPLRQALAHAATRDGADRTMTSWRDMHGIDRAWLRAEKRGLISEAQADSICCSVLRVHPWTVYGEAWEAIPALPPPLVLEDAGHGTPSGYTKGCRCVACTAAMREHQQRYRERKRKERAA